MSIPLKPPKAKLEDSPLWQGVAEIAKQAYAALGDFPEEEKWGMQSKLRQQAFTSSSEVAEAEGAIDPRDRHWHLGSTRKALFGIKNTYKLAHDAGILPLIPETMVKIDRLVKLIDAELAKSPDAIKDWYEMMDAPKKDKKI